MSSHIKRNIALLLILLFIPFSLVSFKDTVGLERLAYVTAIGFDIGEDNLISLTFQFANLSSPNEKRTITKTNIL